MAETNGTKRTLHVVLTMTMEQFDEVMLQLEHVDGLCDLAQEHADEGDGPMITALVAIKDYLARAEKLMEDARKQPRPTPSSAGAM